MVIINLANKQRHRPHILSVVFLLVTGSGSGSYRGVHLCKHKKLTHPLRNVFSRTVLLRGHKLLFSADPL